MKTLQDAAMAAAVAGVTIGVTLLVIDKLMTAPEVVSPDAGPGALGEDASEKYSSS